MLAISVINARKPRTSRILAIELLRNIENDLNFSNKEIRKKQEIDRANIIKKIKNKLHQ